MKQPIILLAGALLLLGAVFGGCGRREPIDGLYRWPSGGDPVADSLLVRFEVMYRSGADSLAVREVVDSLYARASRPGRARTSRIGLSRAMYCDARLRRKAREESEAERLRQTSLMMLDSVADRYDYYKWKVFGKDTPSGENFRIQLEALDYFRSVGDIRELACRYNYMGCTMLDIGNTTRSLEFFTKAYDAFRAAGDSVEAEKGLMNMALVSGPHQTDSLLRVLLRSPIMKENSSHYLYLLVNCYTATDSTAFIREAIDICRSSPADSIDLLPVLYAYMGDNIARKESPAEGLAYLHRAVEIMPGDYNPEFKARIYRGIGDVAGRLGLLEESVGAYRKFDSISRITDDAVRQSFLLNADLQAEISDVENHNRLERDRLKWIYVSLTLTVIIVALVLVHFFFRRSRKRRIEALEADLRFRKSQQSLLATKMAMEENGKFIGTLSERIGEMEEAGDLDGAQAATLQKMIRRHNMTEEERKVFAEVNSNAGQNFIDRLKEAYPVLTPSQLRLAAWIAAGMDSSQIARIFNIDRQSVNKSRYRLRSRLGLDKSQTLESFLRNF